jgi:hypothetical protein
LGTKILGDRLIILGDKILGDRLIKILILGDRLLI